VLKTLDLDIYKGVKVETVVESADSLSALASTNKARRVHFYYPQALVSVASFSDDAQAPKYDIHQFTGVGKAHEAGFFGKGAKVAVIDTGVLYTHPGVSDSSLHHPAQSCFTYTS